MAWDVIAWRQDSPRGVASFFLNFYVESWDQDDTSVTADGTMKVVGERWLDSFNPAIEETRTLEWPNDTVSRIILLDYKMLMQMADPGIGSTYDVLCINPWITCKNLMGERALQARHVTPTSVANNKYGSNKSSETKT